MERHQIIEMMHELKLAGMRAAFDEILANGLKRQHSIPQIIGDLLQAEIAEKQARSIKYQVGIARLPLAKELSDFDFSDTPINQNLVRDLATGAFLQHQRNAVLIGGAHDRLHLLERRGCHGCGGNALLRLAPIGRISIAVQRHVLGAGEDPLRTDSPSPGG